MPVPKNLQQDDDEKKKSGGSTSASKSGASAKASLPTQTVKPTADQQRTQDKIAQGRQNQAQRAAVQREFQRQTGELLPYSQIVGRTPTRSSTEYNKQQTQSQPRAGSSSVPEKQTAQQKLQEKTSPFGIEGISGIPDINSDSWYAGDAPNDIDMFARAVAKGGTGDSDLMGQLWEQRYSKDSASYRPYSMATSTALQQLANLGVEVPMSGFSSEHIQEMLNATAPYYKPGKNSTSGAPTLSRASKEEKIAYWVYQLANDDETTTKAETELNALREEIGYLANSPKNYSDEEILSRISFDKYKTLKKLQEDYGEDRVPVQLTRTVDFSSDYLPGMIWAARNGINTDSAFEAAVYARANNYRGGYTRDEEISAKLDPNDDRYNPYAVGATMDDAGIYYGEYTWDDDWLQEHRADRESPDATRRKNYTAVYKANEFTKSCETELQQLNTAIDEYFDGGWADLTMAEEGQDLATTILTQLMEDGYSNLKTIDETIASGSFRDTTRPIDYKFNQKVDEIRARLEQKAAEPEPKEKMDRHIGVLEGISQGFGGIVSGIRDFFTPESAVVPDGSMNPEPRTDKDGNTVTPAPSKSGVKPDMSRAEENGVRVASAVTSDVGSNAYFKTPRPDTTPRPEDGVSSRAQEEIDKAKSDTLQQAGTVIRESGTEEEKQIYKYTGPNAEKNVQQIYDAIQNGEMTAEQGREELTGAADMYARENYFGAKVTVRDFERLSLAIADKQTRLAEMPESQPGTSEADVQRKEAMLLEAMQTGNMELYDQAQAIGNPDPEAEMLAVRRDALEREIAEDQARLDQMRTEVDRANRVIRDAQHLYDIADAAAGVTGQEPSDTLRASEVVDALMAFDTYTTPDWAAYSLYDMMLNEGADYDAVAKGAADTAAKYRQAAERITVTLKAAEQMGIAIPDDYRQNIESARDYYLNGALDGEYLQLRGREDFRSVADAERAKAKENPDPNGIIDRMMGDPFKYGKVDLTFVDPTAQLEQRMAAESRNFTEAERDTYFYLLGTSGKEAADAYYRHLTDNTYGRLNARIADEMMADARAKAAKNGWSAAIETAETSLLSPLANISAASQVVINRLTGTKTNPYMAGFLPQLTAGATRDEVKTMAMNAAGGADSLGGKFAGFWFDAAVSAADSGVNALVSSVAGLPSIGGKIVGGIAGSSIMGLGAGASAYRDVIEKGGNEDQALLMGAVSFAAETVTEAIELQDILDAAGIGAAAGEGAGKTFLAYMKKQIPELRNEFFGEAVGQAIEGVAEDKILDALSDRRKRINEAVANGEMLEGARREADMAFWKDVLGAGVMGAASTGLSTSFAYGAGRLRGAITGTPANGTETRQNEPQTENGETLTQTEETQGNENQSEPEAQTQPEAQNEAEGQSEPDVQTEPEAQTQPEANLEQPEENLAPQTQPEAQPEAQAEPESRAPIAEEDARARFMRQMVNLQQAAASSDTRIQTTALTSFLETGMDETADDLTFGQASAAAQSLMKKLGGLRAARMLQDIITVEAARQGDTASALEAIRVGAALDGGEVEALAEGPVTAEQLDAFRARMQEAMNRPEVQEAMRRQAHDALVTNETRKLVEDGALKESVDKKRNADKAKKKAQRSSDELKKAVNAVGAAEENYRQSNELFLNDPTNPQLQADVREKGRKLEGAITVQEEYRQSNDNAQETSAQAQTEYRERSAEQLKALREQAEERARAVEEAAQEKRAAIRQRQNLQAQAVRGNDGRTYVNATTPIQFHYAAIDVDGLITSNDEAGNRNPDYPQELQPRDRTRTASRAQLETMSRTLNPELLGADNSVTGGAPIVGPDYVVESGNQRTMAIRQAMAQAHSENYTAWLREHAADFGLDPSAITDRSVLVRVRDTDVDRVQFAREANESVTAAMSQTETAGVDAQNMDERLLNLYDVDADGITSASNRAFVAAFLQTIPEAERGLYIQEDGSISQAGVTRIRNALFQAAYGDQKLTSALAESTDDSVRNVTAALTNAAPKLAAYNKAAENGSRYDMSLSEMIAEAARLYRGLRAKGESVEDWMNQVSMFDPTRDGVQTIMQMFEANARSGKKITRYLTDLIQHAEALGDPNQTMLGGLEQQTQTPDEFIARSFAETEANIQNEAEGAVRGQTALFDAETRDTVTKQALDNYLAENGITLEGEEYEQELARWQDEARQAEREMQSQQSEMDMQERNRRMQRMRDLARLFSRAFGVEIRFESGRDENGRLIWHGKRDTNTGIIYIDSTMTETDLFHRTLLHELTHHVEQTGEYGKLQNTLLNLRYGTNWEILKQNQKNGRLTENDRRLLADIQAKQSLYSKGIGQELTPEEALQEITADATYDIFEGNEQLIRDFVNQDRSLAERVFEWIKNALAKLRGENTGNLSKARDLFAKALQEAEGQNGTGQQQYSIAGEDRTFKLTGVSEDVRYSIPEIQQRDTEYQQAVDNGDMETAQRLTDEAAQKAGYTIPVYHGTPGLGGFTEFRRDFTDNGENEFYFSTVRRMAESYAGSAEDIRATGERSISSEEADAIIAKFEQFIAKTPLDYRVIADQDSGTYTLRSDYYDWDIIQTTDKSEFARELARMGADSGMQIENPAGVLRDSGAGVYSLRLNPAGMMEVDAGGANWNQIPTADGGLTTTRELAKQAREQGYSGVHIANIIDYGGYAGIDRRAGDVYIAFSSSQVKNTQPITYDRGGAVIPLSQRFQSQDKDIRYSLPDNEQTETDAAYQQAIESGDMDTAQQLVDQAAREAGYTIHAYHGTGRGDRVGNVFRPERATSGPMAFFTSDRTVAENYAKDKNDTSIAYDERYDSYETQFRASKDGQDESLIEIFDKLPASAKAKIRSMAPHVTLDYESGEDVIYDPKSKNGLGNYDYALRSHGRNPIAALVEGWLTDGTLYGEEDRFMEVLEKAGVTDALRQAGWSVPEYLNPDARNERVYDTYLKIQNPFITSEDYNEKFLSGLESWWTQQDQGAYRKESSGADTWDKNNRSVEEWIDWARGDLANGMSNAWTSIPDAVTDYLKSLGYDGIQDVGGKNGGASHTVYIPFTGEQVKESAPITRDDSGNVIPLSQRFNQSNPDIRYALPSDNNMDAIRRQRVRQALAQQQTRQTRGQQQTEIQAQHQSDTRVEDLLQMDPPKRRLDLRPGTLATHIFDKTHPLFKMTQASMQEQQARIDELKAKQKSGVKLTAEEKAIIKRGVQGYDSSRDVRDLVLAKGNAIANSTDFCLTKHMVDAQGNRVYRADGSEVGGLADILGKIDLKDEKAFNAYWLALYMKERQAAGKEVNRGLTDTAAMDRTIASTEAAHPEWRGIVDEACEWYGQFMQTWLVNEGLVRQSTLDTFRTMYPHYVPVFSGEVNDSAAKGRDKNQMQAEHLHFAGEGGGSIYNPVMGMAESVQRHIENAKQAEVMRAFGDFFSSDLGRSMGLVQELDPTPAQEKNGAGVGAMEAMSNFQWVTQDPATRQDVLHVPMPDGSVRNFICSDSGIIKALVGTQATGKGLQATARLTGFMCAFATAKNLAFSVQNFLSDGATAMITGNTGGNILTYNIGRLASMFDLARNQIREARGKETSETYQKYQLFGGMGSRYAMRETDVSREFRGKLYKNEVSTIGHIAQFLADVTQFKHVEAISEFLEQATRYNEFSRGNHDLNSYEGLLAAAKAQREVTTDFSKSGDWAAIQYAGQLIPFIRAQMQGTYKTIRMFSEENAGNRGRYMRRIVFNTLVSSAVLAALRGLDWDDEEKKAYEEMNAYEKVKYGHIKIGGKILRIKRTQDGILGFANAVGDMLGDLCNGYEDNDYAQFFDCVEEVAKGLLPSHDTVFEPFMDAANNQTWYGSRIEDAKFDGMAEQDKYESDTLPVFRWASNLSNAVGVTYSPLDWQYICQQYMGSAGRIILGEAAGIGGALLDGEEFTPFDALGIAGDEVLGRVAYDPVYSNYASSTFYDGFTMLSGIQATSDNIGQPGHLLRPGISQAEHKQALKEIDRMTSKGGSLYTIRKNLSGLWKKYNAIDANEMLTDSQKEEAKRNMRRQINEQALRGNTIISQFMGRYGRKNLKQKTAEGVLKLLHGE